MTEHPATLSHVPTILIVDDTPVNVRIVEECLEDSGYRVVVAQDGEEGLQRAAFVQPDLILLDVMMSGLNGFETCRRLKALAGTKDIPVIFMTSLTEVGDKITAFEVGGIDYVTKPLQIEEVLARIKIHIALRAAEKCLAEQNAQLQREIAVRRQAEADLAQARDDLERRVEQRTAELTAEIIERKTVEEALRESEIRLRDYAETASDWFWETGQAHEFTSFSDHRLGGAAIEQELVIGKRHPDIAADRDADPEKWRRHMAVLERHEPFRDFEYKLIDSAGRVRHFNAGGRPVFNAAGKFKGYRGTATDLTERHETEERLHHSQKMDTIGQLTGGVAHDFNNILTVITGSIEILAEAVADRPNLVAVAKLIDEAATRGADLTRQLLAFARRQPLQPRGTDINALVLDTTRLLRPTLGEHVEIESMLEPGAWPALIDPSQLRTALLNLAINARDAMPDGGKLTLETGNVVLDESYATANTDVRPGRYVMIAVSDTGAGIPAGVLDKVIEPFFTTKEVGKGTGLGLSMVYGFVKQSGGHIKIYSEEGHGASVKLYVPRADRVAGAVSNVAPVVASASRGETILLVEDDTLVRQYAATQLASLGYTTLTAANAAEALAVVDNGATFDLLFTDVIMPGGMNGRQLADELNRRRPGTKVLYMSGYTENAIVHHGRLDPGAVLLNKPYRKIDLARKIRDVLDKDGATGAASG
jgi:PAS domain S-box-containing protein